MALSAHDSAVRQPSAPSLPAGLPLACHCAPAVRLCVTVWLVMLLNRSSVSCQYTPTSWRRASLPQRERLARRSCVASRRGSRL